ncbi:unnamed protein product, partial [Meganyctiphanes norvegica]
MARTPKIDLICANHSSTLDISYLKSYRSKNKTSAPPLNQSGVKELCIGGVHDNISLGSISFVDSTFTNSCLATCAKSMDTAPLNSEAIANVKGLSHRNLLEGQILSSRWMHPEAGTNATRPPLRGGGVDSCKTWNNVDICHIQDIFYLSLFDQGWNRWQHRIDTAAARYVYFLVKKNRKMIGGLLDTVGAVCVDSSGSVASSVSSGGLVLKHSGRVGQAAVYGCGCWAENDCDGSGVSVGVSTTGCGEHLIRTMFARLCAKAAIDTDPLGTKLVDTIDQQFLKSEFLEGIQPRMAGG